MGKYADLFDKPASAPDEPARAGLNLRFGLEAKPDLAAEEGQLARRYGLPPGVIQQYRSDYEARAQMDNARPLLQQAPVLRGWLAENPQNARVSHDDLGPLAGLEVYTRGFRRGFQSSMRGSAGATVMESAESLDALERNVTETEGGAALFPQTQAFRGRARNAAGERLVGGLADFNTRSARIDELPASDAMQRFQQSKTFAEGLRRLVDAPGVIPELMAESFGAMAPTMPLAFGGGALAGLRGLALGTGLSSASTEMAGSIAEVLREMKVDTTSLEAVRAAIGSPEFREAIGLKARKAMVVGAVDAFTTGALRFKIGPNALTNILGQMGVQAVGGGAGEALGSLAGGEEINPAAVLAEMVAEMPGAAGDAAVLAGRRALGLEQKAQDAEQNAQALQALMALTNEAKLRERDPVTFQQLVDRIAADGPVQEVFVDARIFAQLAGDTLPTLMQEMPSVRSQLEEALVRGGDIEIPLGELTTKLAGTPLEQPLLEHLKVEHDGMTLADLRTFEQGQADAVKAEVERIMATAKVSEEVRKQGAAVEADVLRQLNETQRFTGDTNAAYAKLMGAFFSTLAGRLQRAGETVTAEDLYREFALRVTAQGVPGAQQLDQNVPAIPVVLGEREVPVRLGPWDARAGLLLVPVNTAAFDAGFKSASDKYQADLYVGPGGANGIPGRYERFAEFQREAPTIDASTVSVDDKGRVTFGDGRHRFAYMRDQGLPQIPVAMDAESLANAQRFGYVPEGATFNQAPGVATLPVDDLVDPSRVPTITLKDLVGKKVFPTIADRTAAAAMFTGIDSSQTVAIPLLGGPYFPLRESNVQAGVVWANRGKSVTKQKTVKLKAGANYMAVVMGDVDMHQSNSTVSKAFFATLEAYARDKRITKKNSAALRELVRGSKTAEPAVQRHMEAFPGTDDVRVLHDYLDSISFEARRRLLELLGTKQAQKLGAPSLRRVIEATREPGLAGARWGDAVLIVEVDQETPLVELGTQGTQPHPDYPLGIKGTIVGRLDTPVNYELLWADWLANARNDAVARGTNPEKVNVRRAFELAKPIVEVTQALVDRIGAIAQRGIDGPRQARLAADLAAGRWRTSDDAVTEGGVSPQEFLDAIATSDAKDTLTPYTLNELKAGIKARTMKIYQLGDGQIYFMLKREPDGRVVLSSVVNNEQGARGIGAPAVVLKALEEGATDLDCFAVANERFPDGFLPTLYAAFGFEKTAEYPFDAKYFPGRKQADAVKYWRQSTPGFDPDKGMPPLVEMKWRGSDEARSGIVGRYLRSGLEGLLEGGTGGAFGSTVRGLRDSARASDAQAGAASDAGRAGGDQGVGAGVSIASRARSVVAGIASLNDNELVNLGLRPEDRDAARRAVGAPPPEGGTLFQTGRSAADVVAELERIRLVPDKVVLATLGDFPEYLQGVVQFMVDQRNKLVEGKMSVRDVAKAYFITISSMGSDAMMATTVEQKTGMTLDPMFVDRGRVRPEHAAAAWLETADGKQALDLLEQGVFDEALWDKGAGVRRAFGDDRFKTFRAFAEGTKGYNFRTLQKLTDAINAAGKARDLEAVAAELNRLQGIGAGKIGFIKHMLGMGDTPTIDAVEINFWVTGKGEIGQLKSEKADLARDIKANSSDRRVSAALMDRITQRFSALRSKVAGGSIEPEVFAHVMHHWLWDRAKGIETTHEGMYHALRFAQGDQARGQITFGADITQSPSVITLLKNADLSTFLHESGHFYLEVLTAIAGRPNAPAEIQADMAQILKWFGVADLATWQAMPLEQKRPYHEQFARGFEAYLFEGRAPSVELQGLFSRFRAWLLNVYRQITGLNVELTPEVRGVFDRMLASEQEIREAEAARGYAPLFKTAEEMGATPEEWAEYQALGRDATEDATEQLQARSLRDMRWLVNARGRKLRELQRTAEAQRRALELEVTAEVRQVPVYAAMHWLKNGILPDGTQTVGAKLDLDALREMYGEGPAAPWRYLPTGQKGLAGNEGLHPDQAAEMFGFSSGDELVRSILAAEAEGPLIEGMTDQRMLERYGDLATPAGLERAAEEAVHNEARGRFIATELAALDEAMRVRGDTGRTVTDSKGRTRKVTTNILLRAAREFATGLVGRKKIRDIRPAQYTAAEARAGRAAARAKSFTEKVTEKRNQLVNHYAARTAMDAVAEIERALAYLKRFEGAVDTIDASYLDQIHQLLEGVELRRITDREARRRASLLEWIQEQEALGLDPVIPRELVEQAQQRNYREMTLEEFRGLVDAVKNIEHLGRLKKKLLTARDQRELAQVVEELATSIGERANRDAKVRIEQGRGLARVGKIARGFVAMHRKFASIAREMDGGTDGGPMWERLVRPMNEAGDREVEMRAEATRRLADIFGMLKGSNLTRKEEVLPGISMTREAQIMLALNWGNEGNRQRVIDGGLDGRRRLTQAEAESIVFRLTEREWDFVEAVWAMLEHYRPAIAEQEKRLTGVEPKWIDPAPFTLPKGRRISGGYFPAKYDADLSTRSNELEAITDLRQQMKGAAGRAATRNGYTKERSAEVKDRPLRKDFGVIMQHLGEVTHRLAWQDWLIDARRILNAGPIDDAIREHYGTEILRELKTQLADIAQGDLAAASDLDRILGHVRSGVTIVGMGWNVVTALMQPFGYSQSIVRVGSRWMARGLAHFAANPMRASAEAREKSSFMRTRALTINRDLADILNRVDNEKLSAVESTYFLFIQKMQTAVDVPTWWAGYERAIADGNDEARAIALADQAVIDSQGGGHLKDQSRIQRGTPAQKLFTAFYNYFNTTYNLLVEQTRTAGVRGGLAVPKLASDYLMLLVVPALGSALLKAMLKGEDDEDKLAETLVREQLNYLFGQMILLREMGAAVQAFSGGYGGPAGLRVFAEIAKLGKQIEQGEVDVALLKAANNVAGIVFHYPAGQVQRTMEGFEALSSGKSSNPFALLLGHKEK